MKDQEITDKNFIDSMLNRIVDLETEIENYKIEIRYNKKLYDKTLVMKYAARTLRAEQVIYKIQDNIKRYRALVEKRNSNV